MGAFDEGELSVAVEVFRCSGHGITFVQQRAPLLQGLVGRFVEELTTWATAAGFAKTFILSSADAACRNDGQMQGQLQYLVNPMAQGLGNELDTIGFACLESSSGGQIETQVFVGQHGFSRQLLNSLPIPCAIFLSLCYEGDNVPQSMQMGAALVSVVGLDKKGVTTLTLPKSWENIRAPPRVMQTHE